MLYTPIIPESLSFNSGWTVFSSEKTNADGKNISQSGFIISDSYKTGIPKTILAALVENGVYKDPYFGENLEKIPVEPFKHPWWYRKEFIINEVDKNINYQLILEGINYKADLWINGKLVAGDDKIEGPFGIFNFNITKYITIRKNVIAIKVYPPEPGDLTIGFVDWNPAPPDKNMGLWRGIKLKKTGIVSLNDVFIQTRINKKNNEAELTISGTLTNFSNEKIKVEVKGSFGEEKKFSKSFLIEPNIKYEFNITSSDDPSLKISNPKLWWPNNLGEPYLYNLKIEASIRSKISDGQNIRFGIREIEDYVNKNGYRGYKINGEKILIKGAGWTDDLMLNDNDEKVIDEIKYAKQMNLNTIRLEGFWGNNETLYNAADKNGILIMVGWSCQWDWKNYCGREESKYSCISSAKDIELQSWAFTQQVKWLRNHPSIFVWLLGSDKYPNPELMKKMTETLNKTDMTRPRLISAKGIKVSKEENINNIYDEPRVKMLGPYAYEPPAYWYVDTTLGGAYGFNTETGPGPQVPPIESLKKMMPQKNLWPVDSMWDFHCGRNQFHSLDRFNKILNIRYGESLSLQDYVGKCQISNYEAMRPMFEAFDVNKYNSTGVIQWMFNSAWPEMYWQLFDYYLMPNGAFYGAMKGCQPLNIIYNYKDKNIYAVNDYLRDFSKYKASVEILNLNSKVIFEKNIVISIRKNSSKKIMDLPKISGNSSLYFINLEIHDEKDRLICDNFYWVSAKEDTLNFNNSNWFYTPVKSYADLNGINNLTAVSLNYKEEYKQSGTDQKIKITLENNSDKIAFFIELKLVNVTSGRPILPVFWNDNYVSVLPHSKKIITGSYKITPGSIKPKLVIKGWNVSKIIKEKI